MSSLTYFRRQAGHTRCMHPIAPAPTAALCTSATSTEVTYKWPAATSPAPPTPASGSSPGTRRSLWPRAPLAIRKDGTWYSYGWDLTKNICELFNADGNLATTYRYTPYGSVAALH